MSKRISRAEHHVLVVGMLAHLHMKHCDKTCDTFLDREDIEAMTQAIAIAEKELKMPVSVERFKKGLHIGIDNPEDN